MNINEAFRLRNRLKDRIRELRERVANAEYEKTVDTEEHTRPLDGKTLKETIEITTSLMDLLCSFNEAIEEANAVNRIDLVRMEGLKQKLAFYSCIAKKCREGKGYEYEYPNGGRYDINTTMIKVEKVLVIDQQTNVEKYNKIRSEIDKLESKITKQNVKIQVDFDLNKIEGVL